MVKAQQRGNRMNAEGRMTFEQVVALYEDAGFMYSQKKALLEPYWEEISATWEKLLNAENGIFRFFHKKKNGILSSSVCSTRYCNRTWLIQHAASSKDPSGLLENMLEATHWASDNPFCEYARILYRPTNRWPRRILGTLTSCLKKDSWENHVYDYYTGSFESDMAFRDRRGLAIEYLESPNYQKLEAQLSEHHSPLMIGSKGLRAGEISILETTNDYSEEGLIRERTILVARQYDQIVGYSLLELSSIGINLSLLLNSFTPTMLIPDPIAEENLIVASINHYLSRGRRFAVALCENGSQSIFGNLGMKTTKQYAELTIACEGNLAATIDHLRECYGENRRKTAFLSPERVLPVQKTLKDIGHEY
jgi:hypothetical protein